MIRMQWTMAAAIVGGIFTSVAIADTGSRSSDQSGYEARSYDYYNAAAQPPAPTTDASAAPAASNGGNCSSTTSNEAGCNAGPSCSSGGCATCSDAGCNASCSNGCGDTCSDCDGCCHEKLPHWLHCCCKLQPCFNWCDSCPLTCPDVTTCHLFDDCCCLKEHDTTVTGWVDGGIMGNADGPSTHFNGPVTFPDQDRGQANQVYGILQRTQADLSQNCGWFIGGDIDFMWGSDYFYTTSAGLDGSSVGNVPRWRTSNGFDYGFAMPQFVCGNRTTMICGSSGAIFIRLLDMKSCRRSATFSIRIRTRCSTASHLHTRACWRAGTSTIIGHGAPAWLPDGTTFRCEMAPSFWEA